jgi:hypothetical protein
MSSIKNLIAPLILEWLKFDCFTKVMRLVKFHLATLQTASGSEDLQVLMYLIFSLTAVMMIVFGIL